MRLVIARTPQLLLAFALGTFFGTTLDVRAGEDGDPLKIAKEAYLSTKSNQRSGIGSGTFELYHKEANEKDLALILRAKVKTYFEGDKYHIRLDYQQEKSEGLEKRIIIFDGRCIITSRFSKRIRPKNAQAELYPVPNDNAVPRPAGFPFDPTKLPDALIAWDSATKLSSTSLSFSKRQEGGYIGKFRLSNLSYCLFDIVPEYGFHTANVTVLNDGNPNPVQVDKATWERIGNVWYVKTIDKQFNGLKGMKSRSILRYDKFEPNVNVPPELFRFNALELPEGAKILDVRPNPTNQIQVYENVRTKETDPAKIDDLLEHLKTLRGPPEPPAPPSQVLRWSLLGGGVLLSAIGLALMWLRVLRRRLQP
jgi:hypothetical protein